MASIRVDMSRTSEGLTRRLQPFEDLDPAKRLEPRSVLLDLPVWIRNLLANGNDFYLVFFGTELAESILLWCASLTGACWALSQEPLDGRSDSLRLAAVVEKFFPVIHVVANAGFDPTGDDVRVCSCVLSFVDSTDKRIQVRVVTVYDTAETTKERKPCFDNATANFFYKFK